MLPMTYVKAGDDETWPLRQHRQHRLRVVLGTCRVGRAPARRLSSQTALAGSEDCCSEPGSDPLSRTLLTVLTVFSRDVRILITLLPARPSRLKVISRPSARRNVCARRKWPARGTGIFRPAGAVLRDTAALN